MSRSIPNPAACAPLRAPHAPAPDHNPSDPTGGHTGRHSAPALLARAASLHRSLAETFDDLAKVGEIGLAAVPGLSVMDGDMPKSESTAPGRMLTVSDLAGVFQVNDKTVRTWRDEGRLPEPVQIGGVIRWHAGALDEWLRGGGR